MNEQDPDSAARRFTRLQSTLQQRRQQLAFAPASGRPARFLDAREDRASEQGCRARELAARLGLPELREVVAMQHIVLYAHSDNEVLLLALRHERQRGYRLPATH